MTVFFELGGKMVYRKQVPKDQWCEVPQLGDGVRLPGSADTLKVRARTLVFSDTVPLTVHVFLG